MLVNDPIKMVSGAWEAAVVEQKMLHFGSGKKWLEEINIEPGHRYKPFTEQLIDGGFNSFGEVSLALYAIAEKTGYDYNYLCDIYVDADIDVPIDETIAMISESALEYDL